MIKVKIKKTKGVKRVKDPEFPYLGISKNTQSIMLFTERGRAVVLFKGMWALYEVGSYKSDWDMFNFKSFKHEIILSNCEGPKYPYLAESSKEGYLNTVVLFTSKDKSAVLYARRAPEFEGRNIDNFKESQFKLFEKEIVLSNEIRES